MTMKMMMSLNSLPLMRKENISIIKLDEEEMNNNITLTGSMNKTYEDDDEDDDDTRNIEFGFYLGILLILSVLSVPPSLTVIGHILM